MCHHIICVFNGVQIKLNHSILIHSGEVKLFASSIQFFLYTCLFFLQALSAGIQNRSPKPGPASQDIELGYFLETGLQRAHVIHFKNG